MSYEPKSEQSQELTWYEHIRKRPGMYLGRVNHRGFMEMLKGIIASSIIRTKPSVFRIDFSKANIGGIKLNGVQARVIDSWSRFLRQKRDMYLVDLFALNALSEFFEIRFYGHDKSLQHQQNFEKGELIRGEQLEDITCENVEIDFQLDPLIWGNDFSWDPMYMVSELSQFACLYKSTALDIRYQLSGEDCRVYYHFEGGLQDLIRYKSLNGVVDSSFQVYIDEDINDFHLELAFAFRLSDIDPAYLKSYVCDYYTFLNGSHVDGMLQGIQNALKKYIFQKERDLKYDLSTENIRKAIIAALNIHTDKAVFLGSVKNQLYNPEIIEPIANRVGQVLLDQMLKDQENSEYLIRRFVIWDD